MRLFFASPARVALCAFFLLALTSAGANAERFEFVGDYLFCTGTCDSFAAQGGPAPPVGIPSTNTVPSHVEGYVEINVGPSSSYGDADIVDFYFEITNSGAAVEPALFGPNGNFIDCVLGQFCNPTAANPLPLSPAVAVVTGTGETDAQGELSSGTLKFTFTAPPFSSNQAAVLFDVATGLAQGCTFFDLAGCIPGSTEFTQIQGAYALAATPGPAVDIDGLGDLNMSASGEVAVLHRDSGEDRHYVHVHDGGDGSLIRRVGVGTTDHQAVALARTFGAAGEELTAVAATRSSNGSSVLQTKEPANNTFISNTPVFNPMWVLLGTTEIGALRREATLTENSANGRILVQISNVISGTRTATIPYFNAAYKSLDVEAYDPAGAVTGRVAVLARNKVSNRTKVQVKGIVGTAVSDATVLAPNWDAVDMTVLDPTGVSPSLGVLMKNELTGAGRLVQINPETGSEISRVPMLGTGTHELQAVEWASLNNFGRGVPLSVVAVLGTKRSDGAIQVQVRATGTGTPVGPASTFLDNTYTAQGLAIVADADGDSADDIAVVGVDAAGEARVQVRNSVTGALISEIDIGSFARYTADVQPVFQAKCTGCHTGGGAGGHNVGSVYADAFLSSNACPGLTVGQCTIVRIQSGQMPQGAGCTGDPAADGGNSACLTQAEQDAVQEWINAGMPQ